MEKLTVYSVESGEGRYRVEAVAVPCGKDVSVIIVGGTDHHLGAAALAVPRPSMSDPSRTSSSCSVLCVTGHKDDEPARMAASSLAAELNCIVSVTVGIHFDNASPTDIKIFEEHVSNVLKGLTINLKSHYGFIKTC
jgi:gallate decarboxylase subunit D